MNIHELNLCNNCTSSFTVRAFSQLSIRPIVACKVMVSGSGGHCPFYLEMVVNVTCMLRSLGNDRHSLLHLMLLCLLTLCDSGIPSW